MCVATTYKALVESKVMYRVILYGTGLRCHPNEIDDSRKMFKKINDIDYLEFF